MEKVVCPRKTNVQLLYIVSEFLTLFYSLSTIDMKHGVSYPVYVYTIMMHETIYVVTISVIRYCNLVWYDMLLTSH